MVKREFYDFGVHPAPEGENSPEELVALAKHLGYSGLAFVPHSDQLSPGLPFIPSDGDFEVFKCIRGIELVEENPSKLHGLIGKFRKKVDVLAVHGGSEKVNRAAVENSGVDILNHPSPEMGRGLNQVLAKAAGENEVAIGLSLSALLYSRGFRRVRLLSEYRATLELARKYEVSIVLSSDAMSCFDLRAPREMAAIAELFGMEEDEALASLSTVPTGILARNRPSAGYVRPGVEVVEGFEEGIEEGIEEGELP
ncbi:MAG: ribonuclease P protein component 3 [Methanosarcinaceae archaeon]|nr:ribonuclease P protein component 3 [Methanosarcinaceae archaeon]